MIRRFAPLFASVAIVASTLVTGCAADVSDEEAAQTEDELRSFGIDDDDNGKSFTVLEGQNIVLKLSSNPTTGYRWVVKDADDLGTPKEAYTSSSGATGSGGTQKFTWKTKGVSDDVLGTHVVKLEYKRSWENRAIKSFKFTINVKKAGRDCRAITCSAGTHCEMRGINGGAIPVCLRND